MENKILRLPQVIERTGLSRSTVYRMINAGKFAKPVRIGARAVGFHQRELDEWIETRKRA